MDTGGYTNDKAKSFYEHLTVDVRLIRIKSYYSIYQAGMDYIIGLMNDLNPSKIDLPQDLYTTKKLVSK